MEMLLVIDSGVVLPSVYQRVLENLRTQSAHHTRLVTMGPKLCIYIRLHHDNNNSFANPLPALLARRDLVVSA